jgi:hypothetical protein
MNSSRRPSFPELVDWVEDRLPPERSHQVASHVESDTQLQDSVAWIRRFLSTAAEAPLLQPPQRVRTALRAAFEERSRTMAGAPTRLVLLFDSRRDHGLIGVRAVDSGTGVHLAYTGEAADLVLDVYRRPDARTRIDGQLLFRDARVGSADVTVRDADGAAHASGLDPLGRFTFDEIRAGATELRAQTEDVDVLIEFDLSRPPDEL